MIKRVNKKCLYCGHAKRNHGKGQITRNFICYSCPPLKMYHEFKLDSLKLMEDKYDKKMGKI